MAFKMKGYSAFTKSPMKQDDDQNIASSSDIVQREDESDIDFARRRKLHTESIQAGVEGKTSDDIKNLTDFQKSMLKLGHGPLTIEQARNKGIIPK
tara:strand:+ start:344 stop:631 length:288 start_codon:yes stop_codon:yes gene_type:complete